LARDAVRAVEAAYTLADEAPPERSLLLDVLST
jgi:hypothetical protein